MRDVKEDGRHSASLQNRGCRVEELWLDLSSEDKRSSCKAQARASRLVTGEETNIGR